MTKKFLSLFLVVMMLFGCTSSQQSVLKIAQDNYLKHVNVDYGYDLALRLEEQKSNEQLGYRTAGSQAEFLTGEMLKEEMESIGLSNVNKDEFSLDGWTFEKAELTYTSLNNEEVTIQLGGYQTNFNTNGMKEFTIIDGGSGTEADLENLDVKNKIVLVDINQRENWWINYPAYEAHIHGATAILAAQDGGYGEVSDDALNAQDVCGPDDAVALSISKNDAELLREIMKTHNTNEMTVQLDVKSIVEHDVDSYNIVGTIPGKSDDMVLMSAHYDSYFAGFQDDNAAIALMLSIAKGIVDSGYQPEKTLVFCAMAAEEWGVSNTRYDWSTGAYNQIFRVHPEWVGKVIADINFELPAMNEGSTDQIRASYELQTYLEEFKKDVPEVKGIFEDGIEIIVPTQTWSDDFSLSIAGIPSTVTALRGGFAQTHYHSQFDNKDTYSKEAFLFHHNLYGMLMIAYDKLAVSPLDFSIRLNALKEVSQEGILSAQQSKALNDKIDETLTLANQAYEKVKNANDEYLKALNSQDENKANEVLEKYKELNDLVLETFKYCENTFVKLTWE
ncbi:MAG: M28 family peptidase, partial [Floccifex sp.]